DDDDDDESTVASLRGELQTLRLVVAKRLAAPTADVTTRHSSSNTAMQLGVVDCLRALLLSLLQSASVSMGAATANGGATAELSSQPSENGMQAIRQVVEGILLPLTTAVDALRSSAGGGGGKGSQVAVRGHNTAPVSPLVLTSALRVLEELVWLSSRRAAVNDGCTENSAEAPLVAVVRFAVTR
ncbi:hypothetical protein DQ04_25331000, partial [Trypanosoma grayi]|uniref:hypothetical protein n=1 Tax=Trypanosoma grayi TaxID=71804 RepID=UPI0004F42F98